MMATTRERRQAEAKAAWARKTPEEKHASMRRLDREIGEGAADALQRAFEKVFPPGWRFAEVEDEDE